MAEEEKKTMKAVWLEKKEDSDKKESINMEIKSIPIPDIPANAVRVKMCRAHILSFTNIALLGYLPNTPFPCVIGPSCIGIIDDIGSNVTDINLKKGVKVLCTPSIGIYPNNILQGWLGFGTETCKKLQSIYHNGTFAEYSVHPSFNVHPIPGNIDDENNYLLSNDKLSISNYLCIAYGAIFERGQLENGETIMIGGATGGLGKCCVFLALSLGATRIYVVGRNKNALNDIVGYDKKRIIAVDTSQIKFDDNKDDEKKEDKSKVIEKYMDNILNIHGDVLGVNMYIDAYGVLPDASLTVAGINKIKSFGRAVLFGGSQHDVPINYPNLITRNVDIRGAYMYTQKAPQRVLNMMISGALNTDWIKTECFDLNHAKVAIQNAAKWKGSKFAIFKNQ